ncbi:acyl-CoA transferase [Niabella ginsenosidivorans]|uniref:Acyl-CoA transferase n=1 Tax=Niabella ginsenosidivorans TaxID=1176587 RepID=A0A1A9I0J7_9BACT|nr:CaiB/BaiF CoA-transferase family protein [Niabella ginsenosidivorans]ANH80250.1 acyl-CoA transferase [Niabella ginsenosidivorans]
MHLLEDILVIDFSQFLSGPSASLTLADMGARVIKVEKPGTGDICRELYVSDVVIDGASSIFQAINRNKESYSADLKNAEDMAKIKGLLKHADVVIHNFRPGVMERLGLGYEEVKAMNPSVVYGSISGFGEEGPWKQLPGQDLLLQSLTGITQLNGKAGENPIPMGVSVIDILSGIHLSQGILSLLYQRTLSGEGGDVKVSMLESALDLQFEVLTCFYNDGNELPQRSSVNGGHPYVGAPYGIYQTADAWLALAMTDIVQLGRLTGCEALTKYVDRDEWFARRDEIKSLLARHLQKRSTAEWLQVLEPADVWCAEVLSYGQLRKQPAYTELDMEMVVKNSRGTRITTTRCPFKVDGLMLTSTIAAPLLGEHTAAIDKEFGLNQWQKQEAVVS